MQSFPVYDLQFSQDALAHACTQSTPNNEGAAVKMLSGSVAARGPSNSNTSNEVISVVEIKGDVAGVADFINECDIRGDRVGARTRLSIRSSRRRRQYFQVGVGDEN